MPHYIEHPESEANLAPNNSFTATANPGYALGRIAAALVTSQEHADPETRLQAQTKVSNWKRVFEGMLSGELRVGSRTPVAEIPAWATLEVIQGGFTTGTILAEGPLQPHEESLLSAIGSDGAATPEPSARIRINRYYLSDHGIAALQEMLRTGNYRVEIPEEGALLVVAWLLKQDQADAARRILDQIGPYLHRLRFYPIPNKPVQSEDGVRVLLQDVRQTVRDLEAIRPPLAYLKQRESALVWAPLSDRVVALFLETLEGPAPFLRSGDDGEFVVDGGWPCQRYPNDWRERAQALMQEYHVLRARHPLCAKPERASTNFAILRTVLEICIDNPARLTGRDVGRVRGVLARIIARRGVPSAEHCRSLRREQERRASRPTSAELARVVIDRLAQWSPDSGIQDLGALGEVLLPVTEAEAADPHVHIPAGASIEPRFGKKVRRCLLATPEVLVEQNVLTSGEALARVIPQITSQVSAAGFVDTDLRTLYGALYRAFRRRRSLLLLNLESQVKLTELPWVQAVAPYQNQGESVREQARRTFTQVATLALTAFPQQILPNKLLQEFRALANTAELKDDGLSLPIVDEVAADIFMGAFTPKFLHAAKIAGRLLEGTLYERYYGLPYAQVQQIDDVSQQAKPLQPHASAPTSPEFYRLCSELADRATVPEARGGGSWVARNGMIIEQEQILTTHNLATLFTVLGLGEALTQQHRSELARRCFAWICRRQSQKPAVWKARLQLVKNSAYAWRQMVFFLALGSEEEARAFLAWATGHLGEQSEALRDRLGPVLSGLDRAMRGLPITASNASPADRFLGWTTGKHWLLP